MSENDIEPFVASLRDPFYVNSESIAEALRLDEEYRMAQAIDMETLAKFDLFLLRPNEYTASALERSVRTDLPGWPPVMICSAETILIEKLRWYQLGNRVSKNQLRDILKILEVQAGKLDLEYLDRWTRHFGVHDLLLEAIDQADMT